MGSVTFVKSGASNRFLGHDCGSGAKGLAPYILAGDENGSLSAFLGEGNAVWGETI